MLERLESDDTEHTPWSGSWYKTGAESWMCFAADGQLVVHLMREPACISTYRFWCYTVSPLEYYMHNVHPSVKGCSATLELAKRDSLAAARQALSSLQHEGRMIP